MNENDRIPVEEIQFHPYINLEYLDRPLTPIDILDFDRAQREDKHFSGFSGS